MARYDNQGYRQLPRIDSSPRRQILGYSRAVQGGAAAARARANQRIAEGWNPSLREASMRARRVANAKASGEFEDIRNTYNEEAAESGREMDQAGNIRPRTTYRTPTTYTPTPARKPVARATPLTYLRPVDQQINDTIAMTSVSGLMDMARRARRRGTLVVR